MHLAVNIGGIPLLAKNERDVDWIRKKASAILERVLRCGTERLRDQEKPYEDYRM
jgi:hypothetical protein